MPKEFKVSEYILDDMEDVEFIDIEFGMNGQPLYIPGPYDNFQKVLNTLNTHVGKGNYMFYDDEEDFDDDEYDYDYERIEALTEEEFSDEFIKNTNSFKSENASYFYSLFVYVSLIINELFEEDLDELDELLKTDREGIKAKIKTELNNKMPKNDSEDFDFFIDLSLENMINYQGMNFLLYEDFKEALVVFSEGEEPKEHIGSFLNYFTTIKQKRYVVIRDLLATLSEHIHETRNLETLSRKQQSTLRKAALDVLDGDFKNFPTELIKVMKNLIDDFEDYTEYYPFKSEDDREAYILAVFEDKIEIIF